MTEMYKFRVTSVAKQSEEALSQCDSPSDAENLTFDNVQIVNNHINECKENNNDQLITKTEKVKTLTVQDNYFNKDTIILNQKMYENSISANHVVNNNSNEMCKVSRGNDTWSCIQEFDLFLKEYKENYDNYSPSTNRGSPIPIASGTQQFVYDINNKHENSKQLRSSPNSEKYLPRRSSSSSSNIYTTIGNNIHTKDSCNSGDVESWEPSSTKIIRNNNPLNTQIVLNYDEMKHYTYEFFNEFNVAVNRDIATNEEKDNIISVSSNSQPLNTEILLNYNDKKKHYTYECLKDSNSAMKRDVATDEEKDNIISVSSNSDSSRNDSVSSLTSMEINYLDEFKADTDSEGYHSSDFEFIDETEASIINKSYSDITHYNFKNDTFEATNEEKVNFEEAGPSWLGYDRLESNSPKFISSIDESGVEELNNNHVIPEGEQLYELFSEPWAVFNYEAENKAFYSNNAMHFDVDNIGFNVGLLQQRHQENEVDDDLKQEAMENARKILKIYPVENAKRRRRRL